MSQSEGLSVLIATRNRAETLARTLGDFVALNTPPVPWELLVVDNGSTDNTADVVRNFSNRLPVRYLFEPQAGKVPALNTGTQNARYDILIMTDDDITPDPNWLIAYQQVASDCPEVACFGGPIDLDLSACHVPDWMVDQSGEIYPWIAGRMGFLDLQGEAARTGLFNGGNMAYRRAVLLVHGLFDPRVGYAPGRIYAAEEALMQLQLRQAGYLFHYIPEARVRHRLRQDELVFSNYFRKFLGACQGKATTMLITGQDTRFNPRRTLILGRDTAFMLLKIISGNRAERLEMIFELIKRWAYEVHMFRLLLKR